MLTNLSIANKLRLGIGALIFLIMALAGASTWVISQMDRETAAVAERWLPALDATSELQVSTMQLRRRELSLATSRSPEEGASIANSLTGLGQQVRAALTETRQYATTPEALRLVTEVEGLLASHFQALQVMVQAQRAGDASAINETLANTRDGMERITTTIAAMYSDAATRARTAASGASATGHQGTYVVIVLALLCLALGVGVAVVLTRSITGRLLNLSGAMDKLAKRDYAFSLKETADKDELGTMARAVDTCRAGLQEADRLAAEQAQAAERRAARAARVDALVKGFEAEAADVLRAVSSAATELSATANGMTATAEEGSRQATNVASASQQTSGNVQTVAASTEELSSSIAEVARQVRETASITTRAAETARQTDGTVRSLADAANRIGDVVRLISDIAGQTNLLALNATIEAARAGEAGKGFAVVASEVKSLAAQTAKATEEIAAQITAMQTETQRSVEAIAAIGKTVEELNATTAQVAAASEQQAAATREIGRAVAEAAQGAEDTSRSAANVKEGAERTGEAAKDLKSASSELAQQSERMRGQVDRFLADIRAA
ncbi:MAG TPA: methyl-accepting chemotaxis protein [Roseococcus sp.]|jgi:methyl-accepting chemotaxis protein|nr:methyl-accepting chemotaxis protein [Roseococcus sp.]